MLFSLKEAPDPTGAIYADPHEVGTYEPCWLYASHNQQAESGVRADLKWPFTGQATSIIADEDDWLPAGGHRRPGVLEVAGHEQRWGCAICGRPQRL